MPRAPTPHHLEVDGRDIPCRDAMTVFDALVNHGFLVANACGGHGSCHLCLVRVLGPAPPATACDRRALSAAQCDAGWRLSCQLRIHGALRVTLVDASSAP